MLAIAKLQTGELIDIPVSEKQTEHALEIRPIIPDRTDIVYIDLAYDLGRAKVGDDGYFALPRGTNSPDDHIVCFDERPDAELDASNFQMEMYGFIRNGEGWCAIVTGYTYDYHLIVGKKGDEYYIYPRFYFEDGKPVEDISVELFKLIGSDADYSGIARTYREYMLRERGCRPIRERANDELRYASESVYIRIRLAWKPVPSPVEEQTEENEPPLHVAMTFDEVGELMERLKAAGVEKAEFCLVGWNVSGHDGRWPQYFPVEPKLGGEERLRALIEKSKRLGYQIVCHTNSTDSYSIANNYSPDITRREKDGSIAQHGGTWGGGRAKWVCAEKGYELTKAELPKVAALGFRGLHYIDVISTIACQPCYSPEHRLTRRQCAEYWKKDAMLSNELFGGFASEGGYDHTMPYLDYGLYVSFFDTENPKLPTLFTKSVPLWQIAFHGITLSNPYTSTVNSPIKNRRHQLEVIERGGRPTVYIYSKFVTNGNNWMGNDDLTCKNEEDTARTVRVIADMYREFVPLARLQTEFIDRHEEKDGVSKICYSDGTTVTVDYNSGSYSLS